MDKPTTTCPFCRTEFDVEENWIGQQTSCPVCGKDFTIQTKKIPLPPPPPPVVGLRTAPAQPVRKAVPVRGGLDVLVPPNSPALCAYYLGVGSLACFLTSVPAIVMGILGIRYANRHPEARGRIHAWVGILFGLFGLCLWAAMITVFVVAVGPLRK